MRFLVFAAVAELMLALSVRAELPQELPFQYEDGLIWVQVKLASKRAPLNFLLDSGSSVSAIDLQTAQTCRVRLGDQQSVQGVSGQGFAYHVRDFHATLGGIDLPKSVLAIDLGAVTECCHQHIDGILGVDFFRDRIVRIDFNARKICLLKDCDMNVANCDILPIKMCNGAFCVPMRIAGNPVQWMRLDTGCDSALEWVVTGIEKRRMSGVSIGLAGASVHHINTSARIGKVYFNDVTAGIHSKQIFPGEGGLLGNGLLSRLCLTIDERRSRVIFVRAR
jgi:hypothetical protein